MKPIIAQGMMGIQAHRLDATTRVYFQPHAKEAALTN